MPARSAPWPSFELESISPRIAISWKSNSRSVPARKRHTGRMSIWIMEPLSLTRASVLGLVVREEKLLALDLVRGDSRLARGRDEPVDEFLPELLLHVRMLRGIHQHHAVLVEELRIALDEDHELAAILEGEPRAAVGERIGVHARGGIEGRPHPGAGLAIPGTFGLDPRHLPVAQLRGVRAALVGARGEGRLRGGDLL